MVRPRWLSMRAAPAIALRLVIDAIPCLILRAKPDGPFDFINQRWLEFAGFKAEEVQGWGWRAALHPEDAGRVLRQWRAGLAGGEPFRFFDLLEGHFTDAPRESHSCMKIGHDFRANGQVALGRPILQDASPGCPGV